MRPTRTASRRALALVLFVSFATPAAAQPGRRVGTIPRGSGDVVATTPHRMFYRCDTAGSPCCEPDATVATRHCVKSLGCNLTTGLCEPCGAPGQACCDGHFTAFSLRNYTGILLDPGERIESCNAGAACDARLAEGGADWVGSRRCIGCGTRSGAACCPPDNRYALGRCSRDAVSGSRLACNDPWAGARGTCVACGNAPGAPICRTAGEPPCDGGMTVDGEVCVECGLPGQLICDWWGCDPTYAVADHRIDRCVAAGAPGQPCRPGPIPCNNQGVFCNPSKICESCGGAGQRCCPAPATGCSVGDCRPSPDGERCDGCGRDGARVCAEGDPCREGGEPVDGWCRPCGREGQSCCYWAASIRCFDGMRCRDRRCSRPASNGGGGGEWTTCNGQPYTWSTKPFPVWVEGANGCIVAQGIVANSPAEALGCGRAQFGDAAFDDDPEQIVRAVTCPGTGCSTITFSGRDEDGAERCAQFLYPTCSIAEESCP